MNLSTPRLLLRHFRAGITGSLLVAALIAVAVFAVALAPRALAQVATAELRHTLDEASPALVDLTGQGNIGIVEGLPDPSLDDIVGPTDAGIAQAARRIPSPLGDHIVDTNWLVRTAPNTGLPAVPRSYDIVLSLAVDLSWDSRITFVDGAAPRQWQGSDTDDLPPEEGPPTDIEIALSKPAADKLGLTVGDRLGYLPADVVVSGIYEADDPDNPYWVQQPELNSVVVEEIGGQVTKFRATAYLAPESIIGLQSSMAFGKLNAWFSVDPSNFSYADVGELQAQTRKVVATQVALPSYGALTFRSGLPNAIDGVVQRVTTTTALLALSVSGMVGVLLAVFALGVQSVIARRRPALALAAARGAGPLELRGAMLLEGLLLSLPGSSIAIIVAAVLVPGRVDAIGWILPIVVAVTPPILFATLTSPRQVSSPRGDIRLRSHSQVRWVAEVAVIGLAAIALFLLARRGLVSSSEAVGVDPLLAATPLLLATAVCVGVLRLYPIPLLAAQRALRGRRGAAGLLGAARAVRAPALGFAAALALVVGIAVVVFSVVMVGTLRSGLQGAARESVTADVLVSAERLDPFVVHEIETVPGVRSVAAVGVATGVQLLAGSDDSSVFVALADTRDLHATRPDIPRLDERVDGSIPLLVSEDWSTRVDGEKLTIADVDATRVGVIPSDALPGVSRNWVLVDSSFAAELGLADTPKDVVVRVDDGASSRTVAAAIREVVLPTQPERFRALVTVTDTETALASTLESPIVSSLESALLLAALTSLVLTMITVVLSSMAAAAARNRIIGVLRILGMSPRQIRVVQSWELGPVAAVAVVVGTALGLVLPFIVTTALDLRPFVGGRTSPAVVIEPLWIAATVGAFALVVILAGFVAAALGRRFAPAGTLKMGEG